MAQKDNYNFLNMTEIKNLTSSEASAYNYIISHLVDIPALTIRELSKRSNVSPTTILRCINKIGYQSFQEFKFTLSQVYAATKINGKNFDLISEAKEFFNDKLVDRFKNEMASAKKILLPSKFIIFFGIGTSGVLAEYGAREFSNFGFNAHFSNDPFFPFRFGSLANSVTGIVLSVSGETKESVAQTQKLREQNSKIISITNNSSNSIAKLSDVNFAYQAKSEMIGPDLNVTTQVPVVFILEALIRELISTSDDQS